MKKPLLICAIAIGMMAFIPANTMATEMDLPAAEQQSADDMKTVISISDQTVTVSGAQGETLEVVSLTGKVVKTIAIESPAQRIELNLPKGCYILKVGKVARKISIR